MDSVINIEVETIYLFARGSVDGAANADIIFSARQARLIASRAPVPTSNRTSGRRPHAHLDLEEHFETEKVKLRTLDNKPYTEGGHPVLWGLPGFLFNYDGQNSKGKAWGTNENMDPGAFRVVIDKDRNHHGMAAHPTGDPSGFIRAAERLGIRLENTALAVDGDEDNLVMLPESTTRAQAEAIARDLRVLVASKLAAS